MVYVNRTVNVQRFIFSTLLSLSGVVFVVIVLFSTGIRSASQARNGQHSSVIEDRKK